MGIAYAPKEFIEDGDIPDGPNTSAVLALSSGIYGEEILDIAILPDRPKNAGDPLTHVEQFALR